MPVTPTRTQRLLDLLTFLAGRRYPVPVEGVMEALPAYAERWTGGDETAKASVRRMFERDKDALRSVGVPIETVPLPGGESTEGYRLLDEDFYLPFLKLVKEEAGRPRAVREGAFGPSSRDVFRIRPDEATAALEALRHVAALPGSPFASAAASAYRKLTFDLDPEGLPGAPLGFAAPAALDEEARERMEILTEALRRRKTIRFLYHGVARGEATSRDVSPWSLFYRGGAWYLVGDDALRDAVRVFRVGRMRNIQMNEARPRTPDFDVPSDFDPAAYASRDPWEIGPEGASPRSARVRFRYPASLRAERAAVGEIVEQLEDGGAVRSFGVLDEEAFLRWILSLHGEAEIELPAEWRRTLRATARRVSLLHEGPPSNPAGAT